MAPKALNTDRPPVRSQPYTVPRELAGRFNCAYCEQPVRATDVFVVHVDAHRNQKKELKAKTHLACGIRCRDELMKASAVEYALVGVTPMPVPEEPDDEEAQEPETPETAPSEEPPEEESDGAAEGA
jgi:hypothetical protein